VNVVGHYNEFIQQEFSLLAIFIEDSAKQRCAAIGLQ
jgi:hypothetical protein